jgi:hypothetical protein
VDILDHVILTRGLDLSISSTCYAEALDVQGHHLICVGGWNVVIFIYPCMQVMLTAFSTRLTTAGPLHDLDLMAALNGGHLDCVKLLIAAGLPKEPLAFDFLVCPNEVPFGRDQRRCLQHIVAEGCPIDTSVLMWSARGGDLDSVRLLHSRRVPFWAGAYQEGAYGMETAHPLLPYTRRTTQEALHEQRVIAVPEKPADAEHMLSALRYAWAMGAPLPLAVEELFTAKRAATRATLLCFGVATRRSQERGGSPRQRAAWAVMGRMPMELVEKIAVHAEFETPDTLGRSRAPDCTVGVQIPHAPHVVWMRNDEVLVQAFQSWAADGLSGILRV